MIDIHTLRTSLESLRVEVLLGFHAISGCDITGPFSRKSKKIFWKAFYKAGVAMLESLRNLGYSRFNDDDERIIEKFICNIYVPSTNIENIGKLRW